MCMAALEGGLDAARRDFAALRNLRDRLRANCPANIRLDELSMGMSGDYEVAIEEGATIVRVGSALFEGIRLGCLSEPPGLSRRLRLYLLDVRSAGINPAARFEVKEFTR